MCNQIQLRECASYSYCARSWRQQTNPLRKNFPSGWKCYITIGSYVSCAFIEIWSTWEVWRALKKLDLLSASPQATLTHLSCSPNFLRASYLEECTLTYEPIVKYIHKHSQNQNNIWEGSREGKIPVDLEEVHGQEALLTQRYLITTLFMAF